jgi:hypothetical protein
MNKKRLRASLSVRFRVSHSIPENGSFCKLGGDVEKSKRLGAQAPNL